MSEPKTYELRVVEDFLEIPAERLGACLREFEEMVQAMREFRERIRSAHRAVGLPMPEKVWTCATWVDDGKQEVHVRVAVKDEGAAA